MNWWDDGGHGNFAVGDKDYDLGTRFAITGSATIAPGWSAGYNITVTTGGTAFGIRSNNRDEFQGVNGDLYGSSFGHINTLYSYGYVKSDTWGTLNWGHLSPASDNPAVLADASGTVIESNFVFFEGGGFALRNKNGNAGGSWNSFALCNSAVAPGADCFGAAQPAVRYDLPTWGGFRFETSYGTADVVPAILDDDASKGFQLNGALQDHPTTDKSSFWDAAVFYNDDWWTNWKVSAAYAYTWLQSNPLNGGEEQIHQVGGTILHAPSGLGVYGMGEWETVDKANNARCPGFGALSASPDLDSNGNPIVVATSVSGCLVGGSLPDTKMWGVKPFYQSHWWDGVGKTIWYGEWAQYEDFFGLALAQGLGGGFTNCTSGNCSIRGSELNRYGAGVVQEIELRCHASLAPLAASGTRCRPGRQRPRRCQFQAGLRGLRPLPGGRYLVLLDRDPDSTTRKPPFGAASFLSSPGPSAWPGYSVGKGQNPEPNLSGLRLELTSAC